MLIRAAQQEALGHREESAFLARLLRHTLESFPELEGVEERTRSAVARAHELGFTSEYEVALFTDLALELGQEFDLEPWARELLENDGIDSETRIDALVEEALLQLEAREEPEE